MLPLALALATEEPPPTELVAVWFSQDAKYAAVETRWVLDGPGFPAARITVFDTGSGAVTDTFDTTLREAEASKGLEGASTAVRATAAATFTRDGFDVAKPVAGVPCEGDQCGQGSGCVSKGTSVSVVATPVSGELCPANWTGETVALSVEGRAWSLAAERPACARSFSADGLYVSGKSAVAILAFSIPGHEGPAERFLPVAGTLP